MSDTTDINALPGGAGGNVTLETKEMPPQRRPPQGAAAAPSAQRIPPPNMANKIISGIKTAAGVGATFSATITGCFKDAATIFSGSFWIR